MIGILNKHREMNRAVLSLKLFGHDFSDYLPRLLRRGLEVREITPFLIGGRADIIQDVKKEFGHPAYWQKCRYRSTTSIKNQLGHARR
ncbi:hypothetical protein QP150_19595 [Sphingomonas sp. 22L2VL55-3]